MKLKELQEKRGSLMKQVREILDFVGTQQRSLTADEETKIRAMEVDIDGLTASIDAEVRQMQREGAARSTRGYHCSRPPDASLEPSKRAE